MKRLISIFLIVIPFIIQAQVGGAAWVGHTIHFNSSPSFEEFFKGYNENNKSILSTPLKEKWGPLNGSGWHVSFFTGNDGFQFCANSGVAYLDKVNDAVFSNGATRRFRIKSNDWTVDMGIGFGSENVFLNFNFGMNLRMSTLYASMIYADGTESYGLEHELSGLFSAWRLTGLLGATMGIGGPNAKLVFKADWVPPTQDDETNKAAFDDLNDFRMSYFNAFQDLTGMRFTIALQLSIYSELR